MAKSEQTLIAEFTDWLRPLPGTFGNYYVGIASDPRDRLQSGHGVDLGQGAAVWKYDTATSASVARSVEKHFIAHGMKGGPGGGDDSSTAVYIYTITAATRE
jgi:hypothetical protein